MAKKLTINAVAMGNLRHRKKQYRLLIAGVILAMIFAGGVPFFLSCIFSSQAEYKARQAGRQDVLLVNAEEQEIQMLQSEDMIEGKVGYLYLTNFIFTENKEKGTTVAWADERAAELYNQHLKEGRMPAAPEEIAIEENTLLRMFSGKKLGDALTVHSLIRNGNSGYLPEQEEQTYTLVGILDNRKTTYEQQTSSQKLLAEIPTAFVAPGTQTEVGGKEGQIALFNKKDQNADHNIYNLDKQFILNLDRMIDNTHQYYQKNDEITSNGILFVFLTLLLAFLSCFAIANTFSSNLKDRKHQVGMLRAVGATRRQIILMFGREALLIALFAAPVGVAVSYFGVWLFAKFMGDSFIFQPNILILLLSALFGIICVMLSALLPLISISRLSPMHAIRDTELMRKMKNRRIRTKKSFRVSNLMARRKMLFFRGRQIITSLILAVCTLLCCISVGILEEQLKYLHFSGMNSDYSLGLRGISYGDNSFVNLPAENPLITEGEKQEIFQLPYVESVTGTKECFVNLLIDGEFPHYLDICELESVITSGRFENSQLYSAEGITSREELEENLHQYPNPAYQETKELANYNQDIFNIVLRALPTAELQKSEGTVIEGEFDYDRLNSGEEIILCAPQKIGYMRKQNRYSGYSTAVRDISERGLKNAEKWMDEDLDYIIDTADSPFHAGDTLTISVLTTNADGILTRIDRDVTIGAIVDNGHAYTNFEMYTTAQGFDTLGTGIGYQELYVNLTGDATPELDAQMQQSLEVMFPGKWISSSYAINQSKQESYRMTVIALLSFIAVLATVSVSLINNNITAQIREGKRTIGTLRAVGADTREIIRSFVLQILTVIGIGVVLGSIFSLFYAFVQQYVQESPFLEWHVWPAFALGALVLIAALINLYVQVKKVSKHSIVDNIREL